MATAAVAGAVEDCFAAFGVSEGHIAGIESCHVPDVGDDCGKLRGIKTVRRHGRAGDAVGNHGAQIAVGKDVLKLSAAQIDPGNLVPAHPVTARALGGEDPRSIFDVSLGIWPHMILSLSEWRVGYEDGAQNRA